MRQLIHLQSICRLGFSTCANDDETNNWTQETRCHSSFISLTNRNGFKLQLIFMVISKKLLNSSDYVYCALNIVQN